MYFYYKNVAECAIHLRDSRTLCCYFGGAIRNIKLVDNQRSSRFYRKMWACDRCEVITMVA